LAIVLHHHPFSRAASVVWMLEELGLDYELRHVDLFAGEHKQPALLVLNPMGKLPVLEDGDVVVTETAAIGLYLADRYSPGELAPALDDPARATYLRWSLFAPSVIEPGVTAKQGGWDFKEGQAGWGNYEAMLSTIEHALAGGDHLLGERFSMADVIFGGTVGFLLAFKVLEPRAAFAAYAERLGQRPAKQRADAKNAEVAAAHGLKMG